MTWTCPKCRKKFKHTNQWHSCARVDLGHHLKNKSALVRETVDKLIGELKKFGEFDLNPVKTCIQVRTTATFLSIKPKKDHIEIEFQLGREVDEFPIYRVVRVSKNRVLHLAVIEEPREINDQLVAWLRESYDLVTG